MEASEIQALIDQALSTFKSDILAEVTKSNQGLAASLSTSLNKKIEKMTQPETKSEESTEDSKDRLTLKALQGQIEQLNQQLQEKEHKAFESERSAAISKVIAGSNSINKNLLQKIFAQEVAPKLQKENDSWFLEQEGQVIPIDKALESYLASEEGACFLPPSPAKGSGSFETKPSVLSIKPSGDLDESYAAFAQKLLS